MFSDNRLTLYCHIQPGARNNRFCGMHNQRVKIQLQAPPVDGKANSALIAYLAKQFSQPKKNISISSGLTQRKKTVQVSNIDEVPQSLLDLLDDKSNFFA
jgi:uncharacterized protein (TIGR00251 family)